MEGPLLRQVGLRMFRSNGKEGPGKIHRQTGEPNSLLDSSNLH
jgi:hypothetical protein